MPLLLAGLKGTESNVACLSSPDGELHLRVESANLYTGVADSSNRTILLYVNGLLVRKDEWDGSVYGVANQAYLGVRNPSFNSEQRGNLDGVIDEVRLYNRALSADEVKELYLFTSAFPPAE